MEEKSPYKFLIKSKSSFNKWYTASHSLVDLLGQCLMGLDYIQNSPNKFYINLKDCFPFFILQ